MDQHSSHIKISSKNPTSFDQLDVKMLDRQFQPRRNSLILPCIKTSSQDSREKVTTKISINTTNCVEINAGEAPPVDESLFFDNVEIFKNVKIDDGESIMKKLFLVFNPKDRILLVEMEKGNIQETPDGKIFPDCSEKFRQMAFLWACFRDLSHLLPKFEKSGVNIHWVAPLTGVNSVTAACFTNSVSCLEYLIKRGVDVNHENPVTHRTCLYAAAIGNARESAELLLNNGAKLNLSTKDFVEPVLHCAIRVQSDSVVKLFLQRGADILQRNQFGETPLHVACSVQSLFCAKMLLNEPQIDVNALDNKERTPLHYAVMSTTSVVELVELLLEKGASVNIPDESGFTALHIAALNEQFCCVESLIWAGADLSAVTKKGVSALQIILKKTPDSLRVFRRRLDASIRLKRPSRQNPEFEMRLELNPLFPSNDQFETSLIYIFIQENQTDIFSHPLVKAFLHLKWQKTRRFYIWTIFVYALAIIFMTTYIITGLAYECYNVFEMKNKTICTSNHISGLFFQKSLIEIEWYISICLLSLLMPRKIISLSISRATKIYFSRIENVLDIVVLICDLVISFIYTGKTYNWQKYVGAFAGLCAWTNMMFMIGQLPTFGTYVTMFTHIYLEFIKLLFAYSGLLIGFMISFSVFFITEGSFNNPLTGFIKILSMMAGDLDFESVTRRSSVTKNKSFAPYNPLSIFSQLLFCLFVILITIILMNLLVGIAVNDIHGLRNQADITKLINQAKRTLFTELQFGNKNIQHCIRRNHNIYVENGFGVLTVKPFNSLEKRLPKDILTAAYEIAQKNPEFKDSGIQKCDFLKYKNEHVTISDLQLEVEQLTSELNVCNRDISSLNNALCNVENLLTKI